MARYAQLAADVLPDVVKNASRVYLVLVMLGLVLMGLAVLLSLFIHPPKNNPPAG